MEISAEISKYPLTEDYLEHIKGFIDRLNAVEGLTVVTNTMSTQGFGEHNLVMDTLRDEMRVSWETFGRAIFVVKYIGRNLDPALKPHG